MPKSHVAWNKGIKGIFKHSEETKRKMSVTRTGRKHSQQWIENIRLGNKGKFVSEETRKKISESKKGTTAWNKGIPCSEETKARIAMANKGKPSPLKGKKHSLEAINKMRISHIGKIGFWKGKKFSEEHRVNISKSMENKFGKEHRSWKGGEIQSNGYVYIHSPHHPFRGQNNYVKRSRLVVEEHLKRFINSNEIVHHINEIKDDDRIENLKIVTRSEHAKIHKNLSP